MSFVEVVRSQAWIDPGLSGVDDFCSCDWMLCVKCFVYY